MKEKEPTAPDDADRRPRISVVVPVFDVEDHVGACLASLRAQVGVDLEVIVIDDGSTDASRARAEEAIGDDPRFRLISQDNRGLSAARNAGMAFSLLAQTHAVDIARYAREALRNLLLLARADALVGTFSSNFGRLAYELQLAAASERAVGGGTPALLPPASLDFPWCADP